LASAYGFCHVQAKTDDGYFLGFPSYWNIIAFYLYVLQPPAAVTVALLLAFSALTFVPARYLYPTQGGRMNQLTGALGAVWCVMLAWILWGLPEEPPPGRNADHSTLVLTSISLVFPLYYLAASWIISLRKAVLARRQVSVRAS
jgi:phosphatidylcholine synthase